MIVRLRMLASWRFARGLFCLLPEGSWDGLLASCNPLSENSTGLYLQGCPRVGEDEHPNSTNQQAMNHANEKQQRVQSVYVAKSAKIRSKDPPGQGLTQVERCTGPVPGEMQMEPDQESTHGAHTLYAPQAPPCVSHSKHGQVMWPAAHKEKRVAPV